ncbi:uncharacterized protein LOC134440978 isoform X2 [Engraulis encrasicolus]|uniref:uncharacterized protein LOC134440978 isoform X2 n=1 Tax=Engraulis encrasicolus TaxID=184585 RepID=UPI002FD6D19D
MDRVTLKDKRRVCLNPRSEQGVRLKNCWQKVGQSKARRRSCLRPAKPPKPKRSCTQTTQQRQNNAPATDLIPHYCTVHHTNADTTTALTK